MFCRHLSETHLLSDRQFGFRPGWSTSDHLLLLFTKHWQDPLNEGLYTLLVALDIAEPIGRVCYAGILENFRAKGFQGDLLLLLDDHLHRRTLHVVVNGRPQGLPRGKSQFHRVLCWVQSCEMSTSTIYSGNCRRWQRMQMTSQSPDPNAALTASAPSEN